MSGNRNNEPTEALRLYVRYRKKAPPGQELHLEDIERLEMLVDGIDTQQNEMDGHEPKLFTTIRTRSQRALCK